MRAHWFILAFMAALGAVPVVAAEPVADAKAATAKPAAGPDAAVTTSTPPAQSGVRVFVDPATGRRSNEPTPEQRRALANLPESTENTQDRFTTETLPSGAIVLRTNGGGRSVVMARPGSNGQPVIKCDDATHRAGGAHVHGDADTKREEF